MLPFEIEAGGKEQTVLRKCLLAAMADLEDETERLPKPASRNWETWDGLCDFVVDQLLWDYDFDLADQFLYLPPEESRGQLELARIDPEYLLAIPPEPVNGLVAARHTLARL